MSETVADRIRDIMDGQSERSFAESIGIPLSTLKGVLDGSRPSVDKVVTVARATGVCLSWLATGEGPMRRGEAPPAAAQPQQTVVSIPRFDVRLSAGGGAFTDRAAQLDMIPFTPEFFSKRLGRKPENMVIVNASGDSMEPTIADGDLVMIDKTDSSRTDAIWAFALEDSLFVKRLHFLPDRIDVISDNTEVYPTYTVDQTNSAVFGLIGRVVWVGRSL